MQTRTLAELTLNQSLDLIECGELTEGVTTARAVRADRASGTQEAILKAAERLYAEHGVFAVSNRQVSEAAGQGNNAAVGYHFGTKTDLVRAIEQKHRASIERLLERMVTDIGDSTELRDWITCMVCSLTEHLAQLGNPTTTRGSRRRRWPIPPTRRSSSAMRSRHRRWSLSSTASPAASPSCRWLS